MGEPTLETVKHYGRLAFMTAVTAGMLALTLHHARRGMPGAPAAVVYALTVGFGLEFLSAGWTGRGRAGRSTLLER